MPLFRFGIYNIILIKSSIVMTSTILSYPPGALGAFAVAFILLCAGLVWKIRELFERFKQSRIPLLSIGDIQIRQPNSHTRTGSVKISIKNSRGGRAQIQRLVIRIVDQGSVYKAGKIRATPTLATSECLLKLRSDSAVYAIPMPQAKAVILKKNRSYDVTAHLTSGENYWYRMLLEVNWSTNKNKNVQLSRSGQFYMEFPPI